MKIIVQTSVKDRIESFFEYLKTRATDDSHKGNGDVIADFVERFMVPELKHLENNAEYFDQEIEIPEEILLEPLKKAKEALDKTFEEFLKSKPGAPAEPQTFDSIANAEVKKARNGNGHKKNKKRALTDQERDTIKSAFLGLNGEIAEDACIPIHQKLDPEVSIFQVTGFVTCLHGNVCGGALTVRDMDSYLKFLQGHRSLWAMYNSPKYEAMRAKNATISTDPVFASRGKA
jgi:hypothetical protein